MGLDQQVEDIAADTGESLDFTADDRFTAPPTRPLTVENVLSVLLVMAAIIVLFLSYRVTNHANPCPTRTLTGECVK